MGPDIRAPCKNAANIFAWKENDFFLVPGIHFSLFVLQVSFLLRQQLGQPHQGRRSPASLSAVVSLLICSSRPHLPQPPATQCLNKPSAPPAPTPPFFKPSYIKPKTKKTPTTTKKHNNLIFYIVYAKKEKANTKTQTNAITWNTLSGSVINSPLLFFI